MVQFVQANLETTRVQHFTSYVSYITRTVYLLVKNTKNNIPAFNVTSTCTLDLHITITICSKLAQRPPWKTYTSRAHLQRSPPKLGPDPTSTTAPNLQNISTEVPRMLPVPEAYHQEPNFQQQQQHLSSRTPLFPGVRPGLAYRHVSGARETTPTDCPKHLYRGVPFALKCDKPTPNSPVNTLLTLAFPNRVAIKKYLYRSLLHSKKCSTRVIIHD
ncbi:hypothetical protein DFP73DRAFT_525616 [Morchella snyderi]|nr:hypothetical protein DFP73DRAFT_525616 [Morchella snyderi]